MGELDHTVPAGMVLAKTKLEALQPSFSASWLQLWMSIRYRVKGRRLEMTVLSLLSTLLSKKGEKRKHQSKLLWLYVKLPVEVGNHWVYF